MNSRALVLGLLIAAGLGAAAWLYWSRPAAGGPEVDPKVVTATPAAGGTPAGVEGVASLQTPSAASAPTPARTSATDSGQPGNVLPIEAVEPLLELNLIAAGGSSEASAEAVSDPIDELLSGKHAGKDWAGLERSYRSVDAVLRAQANPESIPKDMILSAEAISALEIERDWLKQRVVH